MVNSKSSAPAPNSLPTDTLTPLSSTRDAAFVIQLDDNMSTSQDSFAYKMRTKTRILYTVPEGRSVRTESNQSTQSSRQFPYLGDVPTDAKGEWITRFGGCRRCSDVFILACCPCVPAAKIHGMLGSSFESGLIYFGCLVFGMLVSLGLCVSNNTSTLTPATSSDRTTAATSISVTTSTSSLHLFGNVALVLLVLFLLGVALLRTRTRHRFSIPGSRVFDCCLSMLCCWCVLAQAQSHMEKHNRREFELDTPCSIDTLPAYPLSFVNSPAPPQVPPAYHQGPSPQSSMLSLLLIPTAALMFLKSANVFFFAARSSDLAAIAVKLTPILANRNLWTCVQDVELGWFPLRPFSDDQVERFCESSACQTVLQKVVETKLPTCNWTVSGETVSLQELVEKYATRCLSPRQCDADAQ